MDYKRILTIQDISCVGQCSLTVALPILSACGLETAILPSAVLSTHSVLPGFHIPGSDGGHSRHRAPLAAGGHPFSGGVHRLPGKRPPD